MIVGHEKIINFFDNAINSGNLSHAYCFVGYDQVGKRTMARQLAARLLELPEEKLVQCPDFFYLEREIDEKTDKKKKNISITQTRDLRARLQNRSWSGGYQVAIVNEVELLNSESANALLKILEEPGEKSVFFLLAENEQVILPTIRSRCQLFFFNLVAEADIVEGLKKMGCQREEAERLAKLSWGRPGRAIAMQEDPQLVEQNFAEVCRWEKMISAPFYEKLKAIGDLFAEKEDMVRRRDKLQKILDVWIVIWRELMLTEINEQGSEWARALNQKSGMQRQKMINFISALQETKILLEQNINAQLLLEQLLLKI